MNDPTYQCRWCGADYDRATGWLCGTDGCEGNVRYCLCSFDAPTFEGWSWMPLRKGHIAGPCGCGRVHYVIGRRRFSRPWYKPEDYPAQYITTGAEEAAAFVPPYMR
jgi:hypothetical protein